MKKKAVNVSIIVPVYNRADELYTLLESLKNLSVIPEEVIIVDDCSTHSLDVTHLPEVPIKLIRLSNRHGTVVAKNIGISYSKSEYIWFLDSDSIIINPDCLGNMITFFEKNKKTGATGGEGYFISGNLYLNIKSLYPNRDTKGFNEIAVNVKEYHVGIVGTNNMLTRRQLLVDSGGFPEELKIGEDKGYCIWLKKRGYNLIEDKNFAVHHCISRKGRTKTYWNWELTNRLFQFKCSLNLLPLYVWPIFPLLDIYSKFTYLMYLFRKPKAALQESNSANDETYNVNRMVKLLIFFLSWICAYIIGLFYVPRAFFTKLANIHYIDKKYPYTIKEIKKDR